MERKRRIVALEQVPQDQQDLVKNCFYCHCPKHDKKVKAVAAVEAIYPSGRIFFYGICGYHAEAYPLTEEQVQQRPIRCPFCFPRE